MRRILLAALTAVVLVVAMAPPAGAHAEIRESDPERDGIAATGLDELSMTFLALDPSSPITVEVIDETGNDVVAGEPEISARDSVVTVPLEPLEAGEYTVHWHAMSDDGDGLSEGSFAFAAESSGGGIGLWLVWIVALAIPAAVFLRPGRRRRAGNEP
ncbi:MAG: copper resistance protein CopC [Acidimicrobiales bacterium]|nr:copper resistance protein CopC [Acidimicrobiales bacterium]